MSLSQSNLRKQIRKLPKILKSVKTIHYYSSLFVCVLSGQPALHRQRGPAALRVELDSLVEQILRASGQFSM